MESLRGKLLVASPALEATVKPDGSKLRPALSASGRVPIRPGDAIEFTDGAKTVLTLHLEEA